MDATRLHRRRQPRRRRVRPRRRGRGVRAGPPRRRLGGCNRQGPVDDLDHRHPRQLRHHPGPALRDGTGIADRARHDGGRGDGGRVGSRAHRGSARSRRLRQRLHAARVHGRVDAGAARARHRLWRLPARALVRHPGDGRLAGGARHGLRHAHRGRGGAGDAAGGGGAALRRPGRRVHGGPVPRRPRADRPAGELRRAGAGRGGNPRPVEPGPEGSGDLHHPAHRQAAFRHSPEGRRRRPLRHRLHPARHAPRGGRHRPGAGRQARFGRPGARRTRCPACGRS